MRLDDGKGMLINTDSAEPTLYDQLSNMAAEFDSMMSAYRKMGRSKERQALRVKMDSLQARYKNLYKKWEKSNKA